MTRSDWWFGIAIILVALIVQTFVILRSNERLSAERWGIVPLAQSAATHGW